MERVIKGIIKRYEKLPLTRVIIRLLDKLPIFMLLDKDLLNDVSNLEVESRLNKVCSNAIRIAQKSMIISLMQKFALNLRVN